MHRHSTLLQVQPAMQPYMHKYYSTIRQRMAAEKEEVDQEHGRWASVSSMLGELQRLQRSSSLTNKLTKFFESDLRV